MCVCVFFFVFVFSGFVGVQTPRGVEKGLVSGASF